MTQLDLFATAESVPTDPRSILAADRRTKHDVDGLVELLEVIRGLGRASSFLEIHRASKLDKREFGDRLDLLLGAGLIDVVVGGGFVVSTKGSV